MHIHYDWDPHDAAVLQDHIGRCDQMRASCPVASSQAFGWSLFRHQDVRQALLTPETFSSVVSSHVAVPNGMDAPEHTLYRSMIEPYFAPERVHAFEPVCRKLSSELVASLPEAGEFELMGGLARKYALAAQCAFMGWPHQAQEALERWLEQSRQATLSGCRDATRAAAEEFASLVQSLIVCSGSSPLSEESVTSRLLQETVEGRLLTEAELTSILRNWTVGELGTIAASVGIVVARLASDQELQQLLRQEPERLPAAIEESLRLDAPLLTNRRVVRQRVTLSGRQLLPGDRVTLMWGGAQRDPEVFEEADSFRIDRDLSESLLYGAGIHYCPGAGLARMELRVIIEQLLAVSRDFRLSTERPPVRAVYPAGGLSELYLEFSR